MKKVFGTLFVIVLLLYSVPGIAQENDLLKGNELAKQGFCNDAIRIFDTIILMNSNNAIAWNNKGFCYRTLGMFPEALGCFDKAIAIEPNYPEAYYNKAIVTVTIAAYMGSTDAKKVLGFVTSPDFSSLQVPDQTQINPITSVTPPSEIRGQFDPRSGSSTVVDTQRGGTPAMSPMPVMPR